MMETCMDLPVDSGSAVNESTDESGSSVGASGLQTGAGKTLLLVDGHSLAYRMHFALERTNMRTADQRPTWAIYGFFNILLSLIKKLRPDAVVVSFDIGRVTFRNDLYPEYKAHRESMPEDMRSQMQAVRDGVILFGIPIFERENYEADDVIGTLAHRAAREGFRVRILTGDQDAFQLVDDGNPSQEHGPGSIEVLLPPRQPREEMKTYNRQAVFEKWGVYPEQVVDFKGLKGDTSDNIPGVPGIGDKTAAKLLAEYGTLTALYERLDELPANKLREKLETYKDQAFLSQKLATIECNTPMDPVDWEACHLSIPDIPALLAFLEKQEFRSHVKQAADWLPLFQNDGSDVSMPSVAASPVQNLPDASLHPERGCLQVAHEIVTTEAALQALAALIEQTGVFAIDVETTGLDVHLADLAGIAISVGSGLETYRRPAENVLKLKEYPTSFPALRLKPGAENPENRQPVRSFYIPLLQKEPGDLLSENLVLQVLGPLLNSDAIAKLVHNVKFEGNIFRRRGIPLGGLVFDTMIASYVEEPDRRHGLKSLAEEVLGWPMAEIDTLIGSGRKLIPFSEVPVEQAAAYAACDTWTTWELAHRFLTRFEERQWTLFYEIEMPLAHVLTGMEWTGVALDKPCLEALGNSLNERLGELERDIWELAGLEFNLNSPKQVGEVLFERLGIAPTRKTKSKAAYSTDVKVLEQLAGQYEIVAKLLEYRQGFKLKSTYIDALPTLVNPVTHRLHTSFNQAVTATGRLSSSNPNLQNIPIRSELGRQIREAFVPGSKEDWVLISADYSQIELRLLAHFSEDPHLLEAFNKGEDIHTATASLVFGVPIEKVSKEQRYRAKTVNFGVIYGQSPYGLSQQLKIPQEEAAQFIRLYFSRYSRVEQCIEGIKNQARETGLVETLAGRVRNLSRDLGSSNRSVREFAERAAFNMPLQGSAADLMKIAMIRLQRKLKADGLQTRMILQVHDELVLEAPRSEIDRACDAVRWAMELDQPLHVPLVVDVYAGPSWME
jgi:DNA polymerase I